MNEKEMKVRYTNYLLTLGFIFLIVTLLVSMVLISRFVLSDSSLGVHVKNTKNLLDDVAIVESSFNIESRISDRGSFLNLNPTLDSRFVDDFSMIEFDNNKTVILYTINSKVIQYENLYYIDVLNSSVLIISDIVVFNLGNSVSYGKLVDISDNFVIFDIRDQVVLEIKSENILGKLIYVGEISDVNLEE